MVSSFSARIIECFRFSEYKQQDLADFLGVNKTVISSWTNRGFSPNMDRLLKTADFFKVNPAWLAGFDIPKDIFSFSDREINLLKNYQKLNDSCRDLVDMTIHNFVTNPCNLRRESDAEIKKSA